MTWHTPQPERTEDILRRPIAGTTVGAALTAGQAVARAEGETADRARCAAAQLQLQQEGIHEPDPDVALCTLDGPDAVASAGPREDRVLVRASILLGWGVDPYDVAQALGRWAHRWPTQVGTALPVADPPRVLWLVPDQAPARCGLMAPTGYGWDGACTRSAGHQGPHDPEPF